MTQDVRDVEEKPAQPSDFMRKRRFTEGHAVNQTVPRVVSDYDTKTELESRPSGA